MVAVNWSDYSPPKLGGDALAQRGLGRSVQRRTVPVNKVRFAGIYKEPLRGSLNRPPPSAPSAQTPLLTKEENESCSNWTIQAKNFARKTKNYNLVTQKAQKGTAQILVGSFLCFLCLLWLIFFAQPVGHRISSSPRQADHIVIAFNS